MATDVVNRQFDGKNTPSTRDEVDVQVAVRLTFVYTAYYSSLFPLILQTMYL